MEYSFIDSNWKQLEEQGKICEAIAAIIIEIKAKISMAFLSSYDACDLPFDNTEDISSLVSLNQFIAETRSYQYLMLDFRSVLRDLEEDATRAKEDVLEDLKEIAMQLQNEIDIRNRDD